MTVYLADGNKNQTEKKADHIRFPYFKNMTRRNRREMKDAKKLAAVLTTVVLCLGMGLTTLADTVPEKNAVGDGAREYQSPDILDAITGVTGEAANVTIGDIPAGSNTAGSVDTNVKITQIFSDNGLAIPNDADLTRLYAKSITGVPSGGAVLTINLGSSNFSADPYNSSAYHIGDEIYALYETGSNTGIWEVVSAVVNGSGQVDFAVDHQGGFILVKTTKNGRIVSPTVIQESPIVVSPNATNSQGQLITINESAMPSTVENSVKSIVVSIFEVGYAVPPSAVSSSNIVYTKDITPSAGTTGPVRIYFTGDSGKLYYALHLPTGKNASNPADWEVIPCRRAAAGNTSGNFYFELTSFSPVAIVEMGTQLTPKGQDSSGNKGGSSYNYSGSTKKPGNEQGSDTEKKPGSTQQQPGNTAQPGTAAGTNISETGKKSPKTGEF